MKTNPNAPAYPVIDPYNALVENGLTVRALFAKDFMAALISIHGDDTNTVNDAIQAIYMADALIKKLNETEK